MSVSGADDIDRALEKLSGLDMKQAVADAIQLVRSAAVNNCSVNTGELRQSIFADVEGKGRECCRTAHGRSYRKIYNRQG